MNQNERVVEYMKKNDYIDPYRAVVDLSIFRLSARIFELRAEGHDIETINRTRKLPSGTKTWAEYRLKKAAPGVEDREAAKGDATL